MFLGEMASLEAIQETNIVRVPQPIKVIDLPEGGAMFVMEYLKMKSLNKYVHTCFFIMFWGIFSHILLLESFMRRTSLIFQRQSLYLSRSMFVCMCTN